MKRETERESEYQNRQSILRFCSRRTETRGSPGLFFRTIEQDEDPGGSVKAIERK